MDLISTTSLTIVTALTGAVSAVASAISAYKSHHSIATQRHINANISVGTASAELADSLRDPMILSLHGIAEDELKNDNLDPATLSYLVRSFTMGETYYRVHGYDKLRIHLSEYRRKMLANPTVRTAWMKYIKGKFVSSGPYSEAIDQYLESISRQ